MRLDTRPKAKGNDLLLGRGSNTKNSLFRPISHRPKLHRVSVRQLRMLVEFMVTMNLPSEGYAAKWNSSIGLSNSRLIPH